MAMQKIVNGVSVDISPEEAAEIQAEWAANDANKKEWERTKKYASDRSAAYPAVGDQLDMIYHSMMNGEIPVCKEFVTAITAVKEKYPKPQS